MQGWSNHCTHAHANGLPLVHANGRALAHALAHADDDGRSVSRALAHAVCRAFAQTHVLLARGAVFERNVLRDGAAHLFRLRGNVQGHKRDGRFHRMLGG